MSEHYPELFEAIAKIAEPLTINEQYVKTLELRIQLEIAEQLHRIADWLKDGAVQVVTNGGDE